MKKSVYIGKWQVFRNKQGFLKFLASNTALGANQKIFVVFADTYMKTLWKNKTMKRTIMLCYSVQAEMKTLAIQALTCFDSSTGRI